MLLSDYPLERKRYMFELNKTIFLNCYTDVINKLKIIISLLKRVSVCKDSYFILTMGRKLVQILSKVSDSKRSLFKICIVWIRPTSG